MNAPIQLTLPLPPSLNNLYATVRTKSGKLLRIKSEQGASYERTVKTLLATRDFAPLEGAVWLSLKFYRGRKVGDLDNFSKAVLDSLKGICWVDDNQIVEIHSYRLDDKTNPRVEITIMEAIP